MTLISIEEHAAMMHRFIDGHKAMQGEYAQRLSTATCPRRRAQLAWSIAKLGEYIVEYENEIQKPSEAWRWNGK